MMIRSSCILTIRNLRKNIANRLSSQASSILCRGSSAELLLLAPFCFRPMCLISRASLGCTCDPKPYKIVGYDPLNRG